MFCLPLVGVVLFMILLFCLVVLFFIPFPIFMVYVRDIWLRYKNQIIIFLIILVIAQIAIIMFQTKFGGSCR